MIIDVYIYTVVLYGYIIVRLSTTLCCCCPPFSHLILTCGSCQCPQVCVSLFGYLHVHMCTQYKRTYLRGIFGSMAQFSRFEMAIVRSPWDSQYTCAVFFFNWAVANPTGWYCSVEGFFSWLKVPRNQPVHMGTSFASMLFAGNIPWLVNSNICDVYIPFLKVTWIASSLITPYFSLLNPNLWWLMLKSLSFV
jgi:hypothetical protein